MLDFTLSDKQKAMRQAAAGFRDQVLHEAHAAYDKIPDQKDRFRSIQAFYETATAGGMIKGQIPTPLGGTCDSLVDAAIILEELFAYDSSITLTIAATGLGLTPLIMSGNEKLQKLFLDPFLKQEGQPLASLVHSEPTGTANWLEKGGKGLHTTALKDGADWVINGEKLWTTNSGGWDGKGADLQTIICRQVHTEGAPQDPNSDPREAIIIFLVTRDIVASNGADAYQILGDPELPGLQATTGPHSRFSNFRVPHDNVLMQGVSAAELVEQSFTASAALVGAFSVSIMRASFEAALKFAKNDTRAGTVPIIERQSVANLLQDIKMRTDSCRLLVWKALHSLENGPGDFKARQELCLETKIFASELCVTSVTDSMKAVGMMSYRQDAPFARLLNDAMCLPLFDGGNIGVRRRQMEKTMQACDYEPWAAFHG